MLHRITSADKAVRMPPAYAGRAKLRADEIERIRRWIEQGAQWQKHWSFIPPQRPAAAAGHAQMAAQCHRLFILARLEHEGLHPSPEADRRTLIRRVSLT